MCHMSYVMCQMSCVPCHFVMSHELTKNGGACHWIVCYQRGLPHLVLLVSPVVALKNMNFDQEQVEKRK